MSEPRQEWGKKIVAEVAEVSAQLKYLSAVANNFEGFRGKAEKAMSELALVKWIGGALVLTILVAAITSHMQHDRAIAVLETTVQHHHESLAKFEAALKASAEANKRLAAALENPGVVHTSLRPILGSFVEASDDKITLKADGGETTTVKLLTAKFPILGSLKPGEKVRVYTDRQGRATLIEKDDR